MPLEPLKLKPGINSVQTPTLLEGGWSAASNVRFFQGLPQKDAGFVNIIGNPVMGTVRALKAWEALSTHLYLGLGGQQRLMVWDGTIVSDISPGGLSAAQIVSLDNWGQDLLACYSGGPIYTWTPVVGNAMNIATAPQQNGFIFVATQQQMAIACGSIDAGSGNYDPMLLRWCDVGDNTDWTPAVSNQAGSFRLAIGSAIKAGLAFYGQNLIWTDTCLYSMQYIQFPLVWGFQPLGINVGAVGPHAVGLLGGRVFWMGQNQFFTLGGDGAPVQMECPVWDQVFSNLDPSMLQYVTCSTDSYYGEVGWSVPQNNDTGPIFARFHVADNAWTCSTYHYHTAWLDQNVFGAPMGGHENGVVDQHDVGVNANGQPAPWSLTSGIIMISEGSDVAFLRDVIPDFATEDTAPEIDLTVFFYDYPNKPPRVKSGYTLSPSTQVVHPRGRGRGVQFQFSGTDLDSFVRLGNVRVRYNADGKR